MKFNLEKEKEKLQNEIDKIYPGQNIKIKTEGVFPKNKINISSWFKRILGNICFYVGIIIFIKYDKYFLLNCVSLCVSVTGLELIIKDHIKKSYN